MSTCHMQSICSAAHLSYPCDQLHSLACLPHVKQPHLISAMVHIFQSSRQTVTGCSSVSPAEHLPPGFPPDLPAPEPIPSAEAKDSEALVDALGEYTVRALYSKTWQLREAALISIEKVLKGPGVKGHKGDLFKALSRALSKTVQDKVANVFHNSVQVGWSPAPVLLESCIVGKKDRYVSCCIMCHCICLAAGKGFNHEPPI